MYTMLLLNSSFIALPSLCCSARFHAFSRATILLFSASALFCAVAASKTARTKSNGTTTLMNVLKLESPQRIVSSRWDGPATNALLSPLSIPYEKKRRPALNPALKNLQHSPRNYALVQRAPCRLSSAQKDICLFSQQPSRRWHSCRGV